MLQVMSTGAAWAAPGRKNLINSSSISTTPQNIRSPPLRVLKFVPKVLGVLHLGGEGNREGLFNFPGVQGQPNTSENVFKSQDPHGGFYIWGGGYSSPVGWLLLVTEERDSRGIFRCLQAGAEYFLRRVAPPEHPGRGCSRQAGGQAIPPPPGWVEFWGG